LALGIAAATYRVQRVPVVDPGFDPDRYIGEITPEALATGALYRTADSEFRPRPRVADQATRSIDETPSYRRNLTPADRVWLSENEPCLQHLLEASRRPTCAMEDPATIDHWNPPIAEQSLIELLITSAHQQEEQGDLDEALDRYLAALRAVSHWS